MHKPNAPFKPPRPIPAPRASESLDLSLVNEFSRSKSAADDISPQEPSPKSLQAHKRPKRNPMNQIYPPISSHGSNSNSQTTQSSCEKDDNASRSQSDNGHTYYTVQWRRRSNKKNKSWEGDGYIIVSESGIQLRVQGADSIYKTVARTKNCALSGVLSIGIYEAEIDCETTKDQLMLISGSTSQNSLTSTTLDNSSGRRITLSNSSFKSHSIKNKSNDEVTDKHNTTVVELSSSVLDKTSNSHSNNSNVKNELSLPSPSIENAKSVVVDARLTAFLRQHQREGVVFLYECLMGFKNKNYEGALLADEMGLGKTLMTITVIWTLLKQSPYPKEKQVLHKVLICCPVSLIDNWRREFSKWLDLNRIGVLALNNKNQTSAKDKQDIISFGKTKVYQVLIMNYEKVLSFSKELSTVNFGLLVCDEGHRLKSSTNKVLKFLSNMKVSKRLLLTGTPIQNDLTEFFNIANFINPGILGSFREFQLEYLTPITKARDVTCHDPKVKELGKVKSSSLIEITKTFTIRRTKAILESYLTPKTDILIFCPPTSLQKSLFDFVSNNTGITCLPDPNGHDALSLMNLYRKICNSPSLVAEDNFYASLVKRLESAPSELSIPVLSNKITGSKIKVTIPLLLEFKTCNENVVLVSNYTQTLDLLECVLSKLNLSYARLDGSTPSNLRDSLVSSFNRANKYDVFLLSSKAGGVGLNLIGASRLILFDNDWNPSNDLQAMARIHRDGQKRPVFIYRLFTTGCIDEKIFQRQLLKSNLSDMFLDENSESTSNIFDFEDLKDLFTVAETTCNTHDLLDCQCDGSGEEINLTDAMDTSQSQEFTDITSVHSSQHSTHSIASSPSSGWMSALDYKKLDNSQTKKRISIRSALSSYRHFDPRSTVKYDTGDKILNKLVTRLGGDISYIFTRLEAHNEGVV